MTTFHGGKMVQAHKHINLVRILPNSSCAVCCFPIITLSKIAGYLRLKKKEKVIYKACHLVQCISTNTLY